MYIYKLHHVNKLRLEINARWRWSLFGYHHHWHEYIYLTCVCGVYLFCINYIIKESVWIWFQSVWLSICLLIMALIFCSNSFLTASGTRRLASGVTLIRILSTFTRPDSSLTVSRHRRRTWSLQPHSDNRKRNRSLSLWDGGRGL